jgi:hypothetical protein
MTPRELRLWHWHKVIWHRAKANAIREKAGAWYRAKVKQYDCIADFHIKAVQILNDHPALLETTAEEDAATIPGFELDQRRRKV